MEHDDIGDAADFSDEFEYHERTLIAEHITYGFEHLFKVVKTKVLP